MLDQKLYDDEWEFICSTNANCDDGKVCLEYYWQLDQNGNGYERGKACDIPWSASMCTDGKEKLIFINANYDGTDGSYGISWTCPTELTKTESASFTLSAGFIALLTALTVFN